MTLIVGIPACTRMVGIELAHATPVRYGAALMAAAGAIPILIPPVGEAQLALLDRLDGVLVSGSPSNVEPARYGVAESLTPDKHDPARDATTLPLIRAAIERGIPLLAICRGIQELNVALGGTLHQQVHDVAGRRDHRSGPGTYAEKFGPKHGIRVSGQLARIDRRERADREFAARTGARPRGRRPGRRGGCGGWHGRGRARRECEGFRLRRAMASRA